MNKFLMTAAIITAFTFATNVANAEHHEEGKAKMMERVDTDEDGRISKAEFMAKHEQKFTEMDTDADGFLSADEMKEAKGKMRQKWEEKKAMMMDKSQSAPVSSEPAPATEPAVVTPAVETPAAQ